MPVKSGLRHWIEPLQILEKIGKAEGLRAFVQDGLDCGFNRAEIAELYGTYFEDRLAEALALAACAGAYPADAEFTRRVAEVMHAPDQLFRKQGPGLKALPVDAAYQRCFREAAFAVEGAFHRYVEGDYVPVVAVSQLVREAHAALLAGNLARAFDRVTAAGARVLEGDYVAKPTEWLETDPLYSWLLGIERVAHVVAHLEGWPGGRYADWQKPSPAPLHWRSGTSEAAELTRPRREVLRLLREDRLSGEDLTRIRRNRKWIGPELLRLLRMPDDDTTPTVIRNAVRGLGAVGFRPAIDDLLGLLMRVELDHDGIPEDDGLSAACQEALAQFGGEIKEQLLHHFDLALVDSQRLALARVLAKLPQDDDVMEILEHLTEESDELSHRLELYDLVACYRHPRSKVFLKDQLNRARAENREEIQRALTRLVSPPGRRKVTS